MRGAWWGTTNSRREKLLLDWEPEAQDADQVGGFVDTSEQVHPALEEGRRFVELRRVMTRLGPRDAELGATARGLFAWHQSHGFCARCGAASDMALAGWQRLCPACGAHHFPRTDPVVIMLITRGNAALVGRSPGWPEGMYSCLAGFVEPGETLAFEVRAPNGNDDSFYIGMDDGDHVLARE